MLSLSCPHPVLARLKRLLLFSDTKKNFFYPFLVPFFSLFSLNAMREKRKSRILGKCLEVQRNASFSLWKFSTWGSHPIFLYACHLSMWIISDGSGFVPSFFLSMGICAVLKVYVLCINGFGSATFPLQISLMLFIFSL